MSDARDRHEPSFWDKPAATWFAFAALVVVSVVMIFGNLGGVGVWEPWEANEVFLAREYAERGAPEVTEDPLAKSWNWAVPTLDGKPVARPLLKTWLTGQLLESSAEAAGPEVGTLERNARLPAALLLFLVILASFAWLKRFFGVRAALIGSLAFVTTPAVFIGAHNLAAEIPWLAASTLTMLGFGGLLVSDERRWLWALVATVGMALAVFDMRLAGLYLSLWVLSAFALTELVVETSAGSSTAVRPSAGDWVVSALLVAIGIGVVTWAYVGSADYEKEALRPHLAQICGLVLPAVAAISGLVLGRHTKTGKAIFSLPGMVPIGVGAVLAALIGYAVGDANPTLLKHGEIVGGIPSLEYLLTNHIFEKSLADGHLSLDIWVRQIGFSLLPWTGLAPIGLAYMARSAELDAESATTPDARLKRFLVVWAVFAAIFVAAAGVFGHIFFPAYFPLVAGVGLMLADADFWRSARLRPLFVYAMGFAAAAVVLMLGKDLERFPVRFIEVYLTLQEGYELGEDFEFGRLFKVMKYSAVGLTVMYFFGLASWAVIAIRNARDLPANFRAWRAGELATSGESPFVARALEKQEVRDRDDWIGAAVRLVESPQTGPLVLTAGFVVFSAILLHHYVPSLTLHLSQRGVFETYVESADEGEKLYRYQVSIGQGSVYLEDVESIPNYSKLGEMFEAKERMYAVIPRDKLASISYEVRRRFDKKLPVLDARSSRLLLVSNRLEEGEEDRSFVNDKIVADESEVQNDLLFEDEAGKKVHPVFDGQLEMLGYSTDAPKGKDGLPVYKWGETAEITYYFRVIKRVPSSQKIFLHVDYPGNRINGDHYPNDGDFPTNYWYPGDIVKSVQKLEIESYSTPGVYSLNFGFFVGSRRMEIEPRKAHDGRNRMKIGEIRVEGL